MQQSVDTLIRGWRYSTRHPAEQKEQASNDDREATANWLTFRFRRHSRGCPADSRKSAATVHSGHGEYTLRHPLRVVTAVEQQATDEPFRVLPTKQAQAASVRQSGIRGGFYLDGEQPVASTCCGRSTTKSTSRSVVVRQKSTLGVGTWPSRHTRRAASTRFSRCSPEAAVAPLNQSASAGSLQLPAAGRGCVVHDLVGSLHRWLLLFS